LEIKDKKGSTPLFRAAELGNTEIVHLLLNHNANILSKNHNMESPFYIACLKGRTDTVKLILSKINTKLLNNFKDYHDGWTPTHAAVIGQHNEILKFLIQNTMLLDHPNRYGHTPLHIAVRKGLLEVATMLISAGVDLTKGEPLNTIIAQKNANAMSDLIRNAQKQQQKRTQIKNKLEKTNKKGEIRTYGKLRFKPPSASLASSEKPIDRITPSQQSLNLSLSSLSISQVKENKKQKQNRKDQRWVWKKK